MSKWIEQLESIIRKEEKRPASCWKNQLELTTILKCSADNARKLLIWGLKHKKIKSMSGTSLTFSKVLTRKIFYKPVKKNWHQLYFEYAKTKEKRPKGSGWKTFTQLCRDMKIGETLGRKAILILNKNKKLEIFKGGIVDQSSRITAIKFYRLKG